MTTRAFVFRLPGSKKKEKKGEVRHKKNVPSADLQKSSIDTAKEFYRANQNIFYKRHRAFELQQTAKALMPVLEPAN